MSADDQPDRMTVKLTEAVAKHHADVLREYAEAAGDTQLTAILALIARRWGYEATFTAIPEQ